VEKVKELSGQPNGRYYIASLSPVYNEVHDILSGAAVAYAALKNSQ